MKQKNLSTFRLFYDNIIYRENDSVSYGIVKDSVEKIKKYTQYIRKIAILNNVDYMTKLDRVNDRVKKELNLIYERNPYIYEYFINIYKKNNPNSNDQVSDLPFIISCSFYEDYRKDNKTTEEFENNESIIPLLTSLEKKNYRDACKEKTELEFLVYLLEESNNHKAYKHFIYKVNDLLKEEPKTKENHYEFFMRLEHLFKEIEVLANILYEKTLSNGDYWLITNAMLSIYKKRVKNFASDIVEMAKSHATIIFDKYKELDDFASSLNLANDIDYETYKEISDELSIEKAKYIKLFEQGEFTKVKLQANAFGCKLREVLINSYFDYRYKNTIAEDSNVKDYVEKALDIYGLANDLESQIFEKLVFDASHSENLKRNNDAKSALLKQIYELYNPTYLLHSLEEARINFEKHLKKQTKEFVYEYNNKLNDKKVELDIHGPMPNKFAVIAKVTNHRKEFILEKCLTELCTRDILNNYDTRNYDLSIMAEEIPVEEMINLYYRMVYKINEHEFNHNNQEGIDEKARVLSAAQKFVCLDIYNKIYKNKKITTDLDQKLKNICLTYLKEEPKFLVTEPVVAIDIKEKLKEFKKISKEYNKNNKWSKMLDKYKINNRA